MSPRVGRGRRPFLLTPLSSGVKEKEGGTGGVDREKQGQRLKGLFSSIVRLG